MDKLVPFIAITIMHMSTGVNAQPKINLWDELGRLEISSNKRYLQHTDGTPFLWLGGTAWSMYINVNREDIIDYLDNRIAKGVNAVQASAYPFAYPNGEDNHKNRYGHRPFEGTTIEPDLNSPRVIDGGSPDNPNDYWDHSDFIVRETRRRGMALAILPCWGSAFINKKGWGEWHDVQFTADQARTYGRFLAERYKDEPHIIWVLGGDTYPGDKIDIYRAMAEGIVEGGGGQEKVLLTYHPQPPFSSSEWFNYDPWLDFNMIETHKSQHRVVDAVAADYNKKPTRPTMLGEGHYENEGAGILVIHRDAFHSYLSGGMGYVYGLGLPVAVWDFQGDWRSQLDSPGASDLIHIKTVISNYEWRKWVPDQGIIKKGKGETRTATEKVAVKSSDNDQIVIYFADNSPAKINLNRIITCSKIKGTWFNPSNGESISAGREYNTASSQEFTPPQGWDDAVLILESLYGNDK